MSRLYKMIIVVSLEMDSDLETIRDAVKHAWPIDSQLRDADDVIFIGEGQLCGGESEDEFVARVAMSIWSAVGGYREVYVEAVYLDATPPSNYHTAGTDMFMKEFPRLPVPSN